METNKLIAGIVVVAIAIIMLAGVLMPVLGNATTINDTLTNEGLINASILDTSSERTLTFDHTKPNIVTVDGEDMDLSQLSSPYGSLSIVFSDNWFIRHTPNTGLILYKCGTSSAQAIGGATASSEKDLSLTISAGSATITIGTDTYDYSVADDGLMITKDKSDYVVKTADSTAYVKSDSVVYGTGRTDKALGTSGTSFNFIGKASIDDGVTPLYYSPQYNFSTTESVNYTEDTAHVDSYKLTGFTFNLTNNDVEYPITYNQIFVPSEITVERSVHLTDAMNVILNVIPLLVIVSVLLGVVAVFILRRE